MKTRIFTLLLALLSFNGFSQWVVKETPVSSNLYCLSFIDITTGMVAGAGGTVLKTADGGLSWETYTVANEDFRSVCMVNYDLHFVGGEHLYRSGNGGYTWEVVGGDITYPSSINFSDELHGTVTCAAGVFQTVDGGLTWTEVINGGTSVYETSADFDTTQIVIGNVGGFMSYSCVGMRTSENVFYPFEVMSFPNSNAYTSAYFANPDTGYVCFNQFANWVPGTHNQFLRLTNFVLAPNYFQDLTWTFTAEIVGDYIPDLMTSIYMVNNILGYGCGQEGTIYNTKDGGATWVADYEGDVPLSKMQFIDDDHAFAVGNNGLVLKHTYITGVKSADLTNGFTVYPNPAAESIAINSEKNVSLVEVINTDGRMALSEPITGNEIHVDLRGLNNGMYLVRLTTSDGAAVTSKLMIQK